LLTIDLSWIYLGVHLPSDLLGSAALGAALGVVGAKLLQRQTASPAS
jgi:membrane-associated phospholipid phosphatase